MAGFHRRTEERRTEGVALVVVTWGHWHTHVTTTSARGNQQPPSRLVGFTVTPTVVFPAMPGRLDLRRLSLSICSERELSDLWHRLLRTRCPSCHPTNSVKVLRETQNACPDQGRSPTGVILPSSTAGGTSVAPFPFLHTYIRLLADYTKTRNTVVH